MKALPTKYNGYTFRSRTEARWAVFFTHMNWGWQYENQGYKLEKGGVYLPDFEVRLSNLEEWYVEVKPDNFNKFEQDEYMSKLQRFTSEAGKSLLILDGNPSCKPFDIVCNRFTSRSFGLAFLQDYEPYIRLVDEYWMGYIGLDGRTGRFFTQHANDERIQRKSFGRAYVESLNAAKDEKFGI